ncbi:ComEA family DNA-binding protein [Streptosporangium sp. NPDC000563]|uniref:ComEA family DNA-binding protein n=1 Tax=unclassified Streptosporangium TaxID=2632669 RepID=UPI00332A543D
MRTTGQNIERFQAESRLRILTGCGSSAPDPLLSPRRPGGIPRRGRHARPGVHDGMEDVVHDSPASRLRSAPIPPSFEALRKVVAIQSPALVPGRPGLRLLLLVALIALVMGGVYAWRSQPEPEPLAPPVPVSGPPLSAPAIAPRRQSEPLTGLTVHVTGKVRRPGVLTLPDGSRVADAVKAAGGIRGAAATGSLNLARRLVDGEQIVVGPSGAAVVAAAPNPVNPVDPATAVVDLNTATPEQLERLPGVGEVLARRIAEYRDAHGGFRTVEELRDVSGIGDRKYAEMRDKVRV